SPPTPPTEPPCTPPCAHRRAPAPPRRAPAPAGPPPPVPHPPGPRCAAAATDLPATTAPRPRPSRPARPRPRCPPRLQALPHRGERSSRQPPPAEHPPQQPATSHQHQHSQPVPRPVVGKQVDVVADLVQPQQFVVHRPVVELESPSAQQDAGHQSLPPQLAPPPHISDHHQPDHRGEPAESVEETIGDQTGLQRGPIVEVVPVQDLVEHGFVHERRNSHADEQPRPTRTAMAPAPSAPNPRASRHSHSPPDRTPHRNNYPPAAPTTRQPPGGVHGGVHARALPKQQTGGTSGKAKLVTSEHERAAGRQPR